MKAQTAPVASKVANFINQQIQWTGKTTAQIASEAGFGTPNIISMIRLGRTKLPIAKIRSMATALEVDPIFLLRLVMEEYHAEAWAIMQDILKVPALTNPQLEVAAIVGDMPVAKQESLSQEQIERLTDFLATL